MSAQTRICALVLAKLVGRKIDVVGFVDELLSMVNEVGEIRCTSSGDGRLRFEMTDQQAFEVEIDASRGKLRMLCARLWVLCVEPGSSETLPYGGEGHIRAQANNGKGLDLWTVRFKNTPGEQEFTVIPAKIEKPQVVLH